ncbi:MAG TPA: endonuclease/exonuclease/phosphatase family protein [Dongiaceae bacterium]|nr:endonuclease/exonuclease/phosphatase family protein [Dongiaceae bacterium]
MIPLLLHLLVAFLAIATLLAILFPRRPVAGVPQHWGLQLWQLGLVAAIAGLLLADWRAVALAAIVAAYWTWRLWPRRAPRDAAGEATPLLRLVSANLLYQNLDFERSLQGLATLDADVLVLCEVTPEARRHFRRLEATYPHALDTCAPENLYGILVMSRFPLALRSMGIGEDPTPRHLAADLAIGSDTIGLIAIHPTNPLRFSRAHRIPAEFDAVGQLCGTAKRDLIVTGDCNAAGWSSYLRALESAAGLVNDGKVRPSWPIWLPPLVRLPLDHLWVRGRVTLLRVGLGPRLGSDHLPLVAELGWREK